MHENRHSNSWSSIQQHQQPATDTARECARDCCGSTSVRSCPSHPLICCVDAQERQPACARGVIDRRCGRTRPAAVCCQAQRACCSTSDIPCPSNIVDSLLLYASHRQHQLARCPRLPPLGLPSSATLKWHRLCRTIPMCLQPLQPSKTRTRS